MAVLKNISPMTIDGYLLPKSECLDCLLRMDMNSLQHAMSYHPNLGGTTAKENL